VNDVESTTMKKVMWRLIPFLVICYCFAFLDRVNVGFAALQMNQSLGLSNAAYGFGAGLFFLPYFLFEVPSNILLEKFGARLWIARIMLTWGLISGAFAFISPIATLFGASNETVFYSLRFLLGAAEAGFFPGIVFYLTLWFPAAYRARVMSLFMLAIPLSAIFGAPISGALLTLSGSGLAGWQWLFILEAAPTVICGLIVVFYLTDYPRLAKWLSQEQRDWLQAKLAAEQAARGSSQQHGSVLKALMDPRVFACAFIYFAANAVGYGLYFFLPTIMKGFGISNLQVGLLTAVPFIFGAIAMVVLGWNSDRTLRRRAHLAFAIFLGAICVGAAGMMSSPVMIFVLICIGTVGTASIAPLFWPIPSIFLSGVSAAAGIAAINAVGNLSGFVGPYFLGYMKDLTGGFGAGMISLAGLAFVAGIVVVTLRVDEQKPSGAGAPVPVH